MKIIIKFIKIINYGFLFVSESIKNMFWKLIGYLLVYNLLTWIFLRTTKEISEFSGLLDNLEVLDLNIQKEKCCVCNFFKSWAKITLTCKECVLEGTDIN